MSREYKSLADGGRRIKFECNRTGDILPCLSDASNQKMTKMAQEMADALWEMEEAGATPVLPDGKVGGNGAAIFVCEGNTYMLVTKSGKVAKQRMDVHQDFCLVSEFEVKTWKGMYMSASPSVLPTSDTPMHYAALFTSRKFDWPERPGAVLHGHALETVEAAHKFGFPCSEEETLFSTPEDTDALLTLLGKYKYPQHKVFIRKGHGFIILGRDVKQALDTFRKDIKPHI